jgi:hypothetical protein
MELHGMAKQGQSRREAEARDSLDFRQLKIYKKWGNPKNRRIRDRTRKPDVSVLAHARRAGSMRRIQLEPSPARLSVADVRFGWPAEDEPWALGSADSINDGELKPDSESTMWRLSAIRATGG